MQKRGIFIIVSVLAIASYFSIDLINKNNFEVTVLRELQDLFELPNENITLGLEIIEHSALGGIDPHGLVAIKADKRITNSILNKCAKFKMTDVSDIYSEYGFVTDKYSYKKHIDWYKKHLSANTHSCYPDRNNRLLVIDKEIALFVQPEIIVYNYRHH